MTKMIFVNLPITNLPRAMKFYEAIGATNNPGFTDETDACMVFSDAIYVMLLTHNKWRQFTNRTIPDAHTSAQVLLCLSCDSREAVDAMNAAPGANGGKSDVSPAQDHGFMFGRTFADPDGHIWEPKGWTRRPSRHTPETKINELWHSPQSSGTCA